MGSVAVAARRARFPLSSAPRPRYPPRYPPSTTHPPLSTPPPPRPPGKAAVAKEKAADAEWSKMARALIL